MSSEPSNNPPPQFQVGCKISTSSSSSTIISSVSKLPQELSLTEQGLSVTKDVMSLSSSVTQKGHHWANVGVDYAFQSWGYLLGVTEKMLENSDSSSEESTASKTVGCLKSINFATYSLAKAGISISERITETSYAAADFALKHAGAKDGVLVQMVARKLLRNEEASDAVLALIDYMYEFLRDCDISLASLPRALMIIAKLHYMCSVMPDETSCRNVSADMALRTTIKRYHQFSLGALGINTLKVLNIISPLKSFESEDACTAEMAGIQAEDILYRMENGSVYMPSLYVARDTGAEEIIVVFNGTANHHDLLTDLTCKKVLWEGFKGGSGGGVGSSFSGGVDGMAAALDEATALEVHEGFAKTVELLEPALLAVVEDILSQPKHQAYRLVIVGYSLGAAVASLFTLKWAQRFPSLRTFAFAPPGVVAAHQIKKAAAAAASGGGGETAGNAAGGASISKYTNSGGGSCDGISDSAGGTDGLLWFQEASSRITCVILGRDLVPRLCQSSAEDLRECLTYLLANVQVMQDIENAFQRYDALLDVLVHSSDAEDDLQIQLIGLHSEFKAIHKEMVDTHCFRPKLHPIGRLLFLNISSDTVALEATAAAMALQHVEDQCLLEAPAYLFADIIVSRDMLSCHLSNAYKAALDRL